MAQPPIVVYDACVLYPVHLKNILVQVGVDGLAIPHWTTQIEDEWTRNLLRNDPTVRAEALAKTCRLMNSALPRAMVGDLDRILDALRAQEAAGTLAVDRKDLHVLAAAIKSKATIITTQNLKDFPSDDLTRFGITAVTADDFLMDLHDQNSDAFLDCMHHAWLNLRKSAPPADVYVQRLKTSPLLPKTGDLLSRNLDRLIDPSSGDNAGSALNQDDGRDQPKPAGR